ncbi:uncharacterized protein LOC135849070 [Planococcus citri]|uniref:uncharacterized protein LOC135849070 n=1 Tax=Planococcus citri TaxID=170843 RepID=UPI0031F9487E
MPPSTKSEKAKQKPKTQLYCAVCMTVFGSRQSMRKHILKKNHTITTCSSLPDFLKNVLPPEKTLASKVQQVNDGFTAEIYLPTIVTRELLHRWVDTFMKINSCTYVRSRASKNATTSIIIQEHYQCEHHTSPNPVKRKKKSKGTNCRSTLYAVLKKSIQNITWIHINFVHNHSLTSPELLRFKKPTEDIRQIFIKMFEDGATPADALRYFEIHVRTQLSEKEYKLYSVDRSKVPDYDWVRHFFHKTVKKQYISTRTPEYLKSVQETVESIQTPGVLCHFTELDNYSFFVIIISPLMKRVLQTKQAGDFIFTDSCGSADKFGLKVVFLFTTIYSTEAPVGVIIISQDTTWALIPAFKAFLDLIDTDAFDGRGAKGPSIIMIDDNLVEISVVRSVFTSSSDFFSVSHFLRSCYRWLMKPKNKVNLSDRKTIYSSVRQMVYAVDERTFSNLFANFTQNHDSNIAVKRFARQIFEKRKKWARCFRTEEVLKYDTNYIVDFELRVLKEQIFAKIKTQSASQLINYIINEFNDFYEQKFLDCCLGNIRFFKTKELTEDDLNNYVLIQVSDSLFVVYSRNKNVKYAVNSDIGVCTCYIGVCGTFCKHQQLLAKSKTAFYVPMQYPTDDESRSISYYISAGNLNIPENFSTGTISEAVIDDMVEEVTEEIIEEFPYSEIIEEHVCDTEINDQLMQLDAHKKDICQEVVSQGTFYLEALTNINQQLNLVKDSSSMLLQVISSFNEDEEI